MHDAVSDTWVETAGTDELTRSIARVEVVTSRECHLCEDARETLAAMKLLWSIDVREVADESGEGRDLLSRWRPALQPLVLVDGQLFSVGRLPRRKLARLLESRMAAR